MTGPPTEKWALVDVAHNNTRGSSQRLREKREKIRQATRRPPSESDRVRAQEQQLGAAEQRAQQSEQVTQCLLGEANHRCEDAEKRVQELITENGQLQGDLQRSERRAQLAEQQLEDTVRQKQDIEHELEDRVRAQLGAAEQRAQQREQVTQCLLEEANHHCEDAEKRVQELITESGRLQGDLQRSERRAQLAEQQLEDTVRQKQDIERELEGKTKELAAHNTEVWRIPSSKVVTTKIIGTGGWGEVLEGTVRVAVKRLHIAILNQRNLKRLQREMRLLAEVRHPNLVQFIGAVFDRSPPLIVTELLDMNLRQAYEQNRLGLGDRLSIFIDIAKALDYLHQRYEPIIHRDVSAPNVLLQRMPNNQWKGKVSDLGSANFLQNAQTMGEGAIVYSPPEVIPQAFDPLVEPPKQTVKIDVYSYGIVLCEVCTCRFPKAEDYRNMILQVQRERPQVYELIAECTKRDPSDRPSMAEVIVELSKMRPF